MSAPSQEASRAAAGTVALAGLQGLGRALAVLFVVFATREILPDQFARYSIIAGLVTFAGFIADFGSTTVITRLVSRDPRVLDALLAQTVVASVTVGFLAYIVVVLYVIAGPYPHALRGDALIGGLAIPIDAALTSVLAALDGHGLISRRALVSFTRIAVIAVGGIAAVVLAGNIRLAIAAIALGPAVGLGLGLFLARRRAVWLLGVRPNWSRSVVLFRTALPYALLGGIGAVVARLDLLVLSWVSSPANVAGYDLALRGVESAAAFGMVIGAPALFILSRRLGAHDMDGARRAYRHAVRVAYVIGMPVTVVIVALHAPIAAIAFGEAYSDTGPLLAVLGVSIWLSVLSWVQGAVILAHGDTTRALRASLLLLAAAAVFDAALIPAFGAVGASAATAGAAAVACVVFDQLNVRTLGMRTPKPDAALVLACTVAGIVMYAATRIGPDWWGLLALPILPLLLWLTGVVNGTDARSLGRLVVEGNRA